MYFPFFMIFAIHMIISLLLTFLSYAWYLVACIIVRLTIKLSRCTFFNYFILYFAADIRLFYSDCRLLIFCHFLQLIFQYLLMSVIINSIRAHFRSFFMVVSIMFHFMSTFWSLACLMRLRYLFLYPHSFFPFIILFLSAYISDFCSFPILHR